MTFQRREAVHQFLPSLGFQDAVGTHTFETQRVLRANGIAGEVWAETIHPRLVGQAHYFSDFSARKSKKGIDLLLYQASTGSDGLVQVVLGYAGQKTLYYHNITPPEMFRRFDLGAALTLERGHQELQELGESIKVAAAASEFNAADLLAVGIEKVHVIPPFFTPMDPAVDRDTSSWLRETKRGTDLLFVGRVVPNKGHFNLLRAMAAIRSGVDPDARLFVIGAWGPRLYMEALFRLREHLKLDEGVAFLGSVSPRVLVTHYQEADLFFSLSEHEGFGVPLVEAMRFGLPILAYGAGAVEETLGGAGVLVRTLDPATLAEIIGRLSGDPDLREGIIQRQKVRVKQIDSIPRERLTVEWVRDTVQC